MKKILTIFSAAALVVSLLAAPACKTGRTLDIYWVDVEGGGATLIVTPAGESVLIDAGLPGERDPGRIHRVATQAAGLKKIDHLMTTHFDADHYGGTADLARLMPIDRLYNTGVPGQNPNPQDRNEERFQKLIADYRAIKPGQWVGLKVGDNIPLVQPAGRLPLSLRVLAAKQQFIAPEPGQTSANPACAGLEAREDLLDDNANSTVLLLEFGPFKFYDGADLLYNLEANLVCPVNLVGEVDVFQVTHHGLDRSNNPVLIRSLAPTVTVMVNNPRKGCEAGTVATLRSTPSIAANYQLHRNLKEGQEGLNTEEEFIANLESDCAANYIRLSVAADGRSYKIMIPGTGHERTFRTKSPGPTS